MLLWCNKDKWRLWRLQHESWKSYSKLNVLTIYIDKIPVNSLNKPNFKGARSFEEAHDSVSSLSMYKPKFEHSIRTDVIDNKQCAPSPRCQRVKQIMHLLTIHWSITNNSLITVAGDYQGWLAVTGLLDKWRRLYTIEVLLISPTVDRGFVLDARLQAVLLSLLIDEGTYISLEVSISSLC